MKRSILGALIFSLYLFVNPVDATEIPQKSSILTDIFAEVDRSYRTTQGNEPPRGFQKMAEKGLKALEQRNYEEAIANFEEAVKLWPHDENVHLNLAASLCFNSLQQPG
jgi:Tfp pilus assembly protein PilF